MKSYLIIVSCILAALAAQALAYSDDGHMYVAKIAYDRLPAAKQKKLDDLVKLLKNGRAPYNSVSAACWPDDVKHNPAFEGTGDWHFIDMPLNGGTLPTKANVLDGIKKNIADYQAAAAAPATPANKLKQARAIVFLIHLAGDIHQPLHCSEPGGSTGGNGITVANVQPPGNLHHFWDGAYGASFDRASGKSVLPGNGVRPTTAKAKAFADRTTAIMTGHTPGPLWNSNGQDYQAWANQTFAIAKRAAYGPLAVHGPPYAPVTLSEAYVNKARDITDQRVTLAGYRLAKLLDSLL
jgi:S1/P1 Nuclease